MLADGADANAANRYGVTPLALACANGNTVLVAALLEAGAHPDDEGNGGETPLMIAARTGRGGPVKALLEAGAEVNARDGKGQSALMWAAAEGHAEAVKILLDAGARREMALGSGFDAWFFAARQGHRGVIDLLLADGAGVNAVLKSGGGGRAPRKGMSALLFAMENGHFALAAHLLDAGADANDIRSGFAPLHVLSWVRKPRRGDAIDGLPPPRGSGAMTSLEVVDVLVGHGARVNARIEKTVKGGRLGWEGATPFLLASRTADLPLMKRLLNHGADFRAANSLGRTPLLAAAGVGLGPESDEASIEEEALAAARLLLDLGADINVVDRKGETVMHAAAYKQAPKLVHLFAEEGADIAVWNAKNRSASTPLLIAQGFRPGNFKPSEATIAAISQVMRAKGIEPPPAPPPPGTDKREEYRN